MKEHVNHRISFRNQTHIPIEIPYEENLSEHLTIDNSPVLFGCRTGVCGTCLISVDQVHQGQLAPASEDEKDLLSIIAPECSEARLACQIKLTADIQIAYLSQ